MLWIKIFTNSPVAEIFEFKCCCIPDQNTEFQLHNKGEKQLKIQSYCDLEAEGGKKFRVNYLFPQGLLKVDPGDSAAFYCSMTEEMLGGYQRIIFYDENGEDYCSNIREIKHTHPV